MLYVRYIILHFSNKVRHIILLLLLHLLHFTKYELKKIVYKYTIVDIICKKLLRKILNIDFKFKLNN